MMRYRSKLPDVSAYRTGRPKPPTDEGAPVRVDRYLHAGQYLVGEEPTAVTTVLGSCVAVCIFSTERMVGGINHFVLPTWAGSGRASPRFGNVAVPSLIEGVLSQGCTLSELKAKIFGGAAILSANASSPSRDGLGERNVQIACELLEGEGIEIVNTDTGGTQGRKLIFHTDDGTAWIRRI